MFNALRDLLDYPALGDAGYCEVCDRHAPKDDDGRLTGEVPHTDDCFVLAGRRAIAAVEGESVERAEEGAVNHG